MRKKATVLRTDKSAQRTGWRAPQRAPKPPHANRAPMDRATPTKRLVSAVRATVADRPPDQQQGRQRSTERRQRLLLDAESGQDQLSGREQAEEKPAIEIIAGGGRQPGHGDESDRVGHRALPVRRESSSRGVPARPARVASTPRPHSWPAGTPPARRRCSSRAARRRSSRRPQEAAGDRDRRWPPPAAPAQQHLAAELDGEEITEQDEGVGLVAVDDERRHEATGQAAAERRIDLAAAPARWRRP